MLIRTVDLEETNRTYIGYLHEWKVGEYSYILGNDTELAMVYF